MSQFLLTHVNNILDNTSKVIGQKKKAIMKFDVLIFLLFMFKHVAY